MTRISDLQGRNAERRLQLGLARAPQKNAAFSSLTIPTMNTRTLNRNGYTSAMIPIGSHPALHPVFEALGYVVGYLVFRRERVRYGDFMPEGQRWTVLAAAAIGALVGCRVLGLAEQWPVVVEAWRSGAFLKLLFSPGGKTVVGGLLGGWLGVEITKKFSGIHRRTGDLFVLPLCVGIAIGRVGCLISGLADDTYGKPTGLPWAVDFGDGIGRHPVQAYEIVFLILIAVLLGRADKWPEGARFRVFLASYLAWRLSIDFLKPQPVIHGLDVIQWASFAGLSVLALSWGLDLQGKRKGSHEQAAG